MDTQANPRHMSDCKYSHRQADTRRVKPCRGAAACTKALGTCAVTQTHKCSCAKSHTCTDTDRSGYVGVIGQWASDFSLSLSLSQPHTHQSNLCSSEDISLLWTGLDCGAMKASAHQAPAWVQSLPLEPSRAEARLEESRLLSPG